MNEIPSALAAVKGQARWRGSRWSPLTAASLRQGSGYEGAALPMPKLRDGVRINQKMKKRQPAPNVTMGSCLPVAVENLTLV
jgi:hypothetical protein